MTDPSVMDPLSADELLARARVDRPDAWLDDAIYVAHARSFGPVDAAIHAGDLYLALACAYGIAAAIDALEREHFVRIREFAASVDSTPAFVTELSQQLRARVLVAEPGQLPRIASYSGRGSLGAWIRVSAVRLARDLARSERGHAARVQRAALEPAAIDPELGYLKQAYGEVVSRAVEGALADLDAESRALLKMHYVDGLTIEQVGVAFGKSRATSARMLAAARMTVVAGIRQRLVSTIGIRADEADSLLAFVRSRLDVSLGTALRK